MANPLAFLGMILLVAGAILVVTTLTISVNFLGVLLLAIGIYLTIKIKVYSKL
jgi:hypothetical protein